MRTTRRTIATALLLATVGGSLSTAAVGGLALSAPPAAAVYRPFERGSYWNTPLPRSAPRHRYSREMIRFLIADNDTDFIRLAGATNDGSWGMPVYWSGSASREYDVRNNCSQGQPPEFDRVRIPRGAEPDPTSDGAMTVYDRERGKIYGFADARYDAGNDVWSACGGTVYYLGSNGLHGELAASDQPRNRGHRGLPPSTWAVRYGQIEAGRINHVLKIAVNRTKCRHVFPMVGNECGSSASYAPPEGTRIRIRPAVDLAGLRLSPAARVIAEALQRYGAVIGDQTGGPMILKVENTVAEDRGWLWEDVLSPHSLSRIPLRYFEVIAPGYRP